ncbi:MAG: hypothetical protein MHMPM18_003718 [Marteilia pararefringens]
MSLEQKKRRFEVYLNRRAMGKSKLRIYSLRDATEGIVKFSNNLVLLTDVEMVVQEAGRLDTLKRLSTKSRVSKTVHSFLRGTLMYRGRNALKTAKKLGLTEANTQAKRIGYDPTKSANWLIIEQSNMPMNVADCDVVLRSKYALMHDSGILVL